MKRKSYGHGTDTPITMDMGGFYVHYRNHLGGARKDFHKVVDHTNALRETIVLHGGEIDDSPCRIERIDIFGNHTHTWTSDNIWDSCLRLQWSDRDDYERRERRRYRRYSNRAGDRG